MTESPNDRPDFQLVPANRFCPQLIGFEALLGKPLFSKIDETIGFRQSSSVVLEGPPGSGKTVASLAICRCLMAEDTRLFYLSTEVDRKEIEGKLEDFGWFESAQGPNLFARENVFFADLPRGQMDRPLPRSSDLINEVFKQLRADRRYKKSQSLVIVDSLTGFLRDASTSGDRRRHTEDFLGRLRSEFERDLAMVFLITESPELPKNDIPAEQYVADYVFRLGDRETAGGKRIRTWEVVKSHGTYMVPGEHTWEIYTGATACSLFDDQDLRDHVRSLALDPQQSHPKESSNEHARTVEADVEVPNEAIPACHVAASAVVTKEEQKFATIVFFPQWSMHLNTGTSAASDDRRESHYTEFVWSGTPGLDELLRGDTEYWSRTDKWSQSRTGSSWTPGLKPGETTLLLGASGTGKTLTAVQFLYGNLHTNGVIDGENQTPLRQKLRKRFPGKKRTEFTGENVSHRLRETFRRTLFISFEGTKQSLHTYRDSSEDFWLLFSNGSSIFVSPADVDFNRLLFQVRWIIRNRRVERVAIDGLGELLSTVDRNSRSGMVNALFRTIQMANDHQTPPTILATSELGHNDEPLLLDAEGVSAISDNVVALKQIRINDQLRKAIYVVKAKNQRHDRQVRELVINTRDTEKTPGLRIQGGFEGFSDVLSGRPTKVSIALQLFHENAEEDHFNEKMLEFLKKSFAFEITRHTFAHSELSLFLDDARGVLGQVPATDIKVISLDEWWLRELQQRNAPEGSQQVHVEDLPSPLLRVDGFFALREPSESNRSPFLHQQQRSAAAMEGLASEHWITEVEKGTRTLVTYGKVGEVQEIDAQLLAMPNYADFGMFCLNIPMAMKLGMTSVSLEEVRAFIPRLWAKPTKIAGHQWYEPPCAEGKSIADLLYRTTEQGKHPEKGFAFELDRGETALCFLLELAWSFGVGEDFLNSAAIDFVEKDGKPSHRGAEALRGGLRLLQYLIYHGLMRPYPKSGDAEDAILSRQWYSTLNTESGAQLDRTEKLNAESKLQPEVKENDVEKAKNKHNLAPIPFFPVSLLPEENLRHLIVEELRDGRRHLSGICNRIIAAFRWINRYRMGLEKRQTESNANSAFLKQWVTSMKTAITSVSTIRSEIQSLRVKLDGLDAPNVDVSTLKQLQGSLCDTAERLMEEVLKPNVGMSGRRLRWARWKPDSLADEGGQTEITHPQWVAAGMAMDARDVRQMIDWLKVRLTLLDREIEGMSPPDSDAESGYEVTALAGFGCSGSWMLGVSRNTHSPGLSWKLIEEMSSRRSNDQRAKLGAGIPSRKDFYEFHGDEYVPRIPKGCETIWSDFLTVAGAKVRRRDRAICSKVPLSQLSSLIRTQIFRCIEVAATEFARRGEEDAEESAIDDSVQRMNAIIDDAVREILLYIANEQGRSQPKRCEGCPRTHAEIPGDDCGVSLTPRFTFAACNPSASGEPAEQRGSDNEHA